MMADVNPRSLIEPVVALACEAGRAILEVYERNFAVTEKEDRSPLTEADLAAHRTIARGLATLTPDLPLLSEESRAIPVAERHAWECFWLVDPLDGTREFIKRNGEFTVNIALIDKGEVVLGVVHVPVTGVTYSACRGGGAWRRSGTDAPQRLVATVPAADPVRVVGSRSHRGDSLDAFLARLGAHEMVGMGSSLKFCLVAEGRADVYPRLGPTSEWDTAAAQCVVEEAGGRVADLSGVPLRYNARDTLLNPHFLVYADRGRDWFALLG